MIPVDKDDMFLWKCKKCGHEVCFDGVIWRCKCRECGYWMFWTKIEGVPAVE